MPGRVLQLYVKTRFLFLHRHVVVIFISAKTLLVTRTFRRFHYPHLDCFDVYVDVHRPAVLIHRPVVPGDERHDR